MTEQKDKEIELIYEKYIRELGEHNELVVRYETLQAQVDMLVESLEIANRCIDNGDLILKGSAYDQIIKAALERVEKRKEESEHVE